MTEKERLDEMVTPFLRAIALAEGDDLPRLILADRLEEWGLHKESLGQRWAVRERKFPFDNRKREVLTGGWYTYYEENLTDFIRRYHLAPSTSFLSFPLFPAHMGNSDGLSIEDPDKPLGGLLGCERLFLRVCGELFWDDAGPYSKRQVEEVQRRVITHEVNKVFVLDTHHRRRINSPKVKTLEKSFSQATALLPCPCRHTSELSWIWDPTKKPRIDMPNFRDVVLNRSVYRDYGRDWVTHSGYCQGCNTVYVSTPKPRT